MSPNEQTPGGKVIVPSNLYTAILALAVCVVLATAAFVACKCYFQFETIFKVP